MANISFLFLVIDKIENFIKYKIEVVFLKYLNFFMREWGALNVLTIRSRVNYFLNSRT